MFREEKTTQMAAQFLTLADGRLPYVLLMKLLYLADKQMLVQWGKPITYDRWFSMKHGPILRATLDLIKTEPRTGGYWVEHIGVEGYDVVLKNDPGNEDLSRAEDKIIAETFREWGHKDKWEVVRYTHGLPEWNDPGDTSDPISYKTVLEVSGLAQEDIAVILENIEMQDDAWEMKRGLGLERVA